MQGPFPLSRAPYIPTFNDGEGDPSNVGTTADGVSEFSARRDHVHAGAHLSPNDPTVNDDVTLGYTPGFIWIKTATSEAYICVDNSAGAAIWQAVGGGTAGGGGAGDLYAYIDGALSVSTEVVSWLAPRTMTLELVYIYCVDPGSASSTIVDVNLNGTTIFTTQANRPELAFDDANGWAVSGTPELLDVVEGDVLSFDIDQIGTDASGLVVVIKVASAGGTPPGEVTVAGALKVYLYHNFR